ISGPTMSLTNSILRSMDESVVVNASPIIAWGKMGSLDLIPRLPYRFITPVQVQNEINAGTRKGLPVVVPTWIEVVELSNPPSLLYIATLDAGEAAVIELAPELGMRLVCLDELKGRRAAKAAGLEVVGSLGMVGRLKALGLASPLRPMIRRAQDEGIYYDDE